MESTKNRKSTGKRKSHRVERRDKRKNLEENDKTMFHLI